MAMVSSDRTHYSSYVVGAAIPLSLYLSYALVALGLDKYHYLLAGGRRYPTFPDLTSQFTIGFVYLALWGLYLLWLFLPTAASGARSFRQVLLFTGIFLLLAYAAYPLGDDIYVYLHAGLMNLRGANPYLVRADAFSSELTPFLAWGQTSTYGPLSQVLFSLSALAIPTSPLLAVYSFKAVCLGCHTLNGYLVWRLLPDEHRSRVAIAYLVNPILLIEQVASAHVDIFVSTSLLLLATSLAKRHYVLGMAAIWVGILAKTIPIIWLPLLVLFLARQRQWKALLVGVVLSIALISFLSITVLPEVAAWRSLLNPGVTGLYQSSIAAFVRASLDTWRVVVPGSVTLAESRMLVTHLSQGLQAGFVGLYGWIVWRILRQQPSTADSLLTACGWTTLALMLVTSWIVPWYASITLAIVAVVPTARLLGLTSLMFCLSSSAAYTLQGHQHSFKAVVVLGIPLLAIVLGQIVWHGRSPQPT
jgi:alpha-1,6-mannosyltransferase